MKKKKKSVLLSMCLKKKKKFKVSTLKITLHKIYLVRTIKKYILIEESFSLN